MLCPQWRAKFSPQEKMEMGSVDYLPASTGTQSYHDLIGTKTHEIVQAPTVHAYTAVDKTLDLCICPSIPIGDSTKGATIK